MIALEENRHKQQTLMSNKNKKPWHRKLKPEKEIMKILSSILIKNYPDTKYMRKKKPHHSCDTENYYTPVNTTSSQCFRLLIIH